MTEEARLAILENNMTEIKQEISDIKSEIKGLSKQIELVLTAKLQEHVEFKARLDLLEKQNMKFEQQSNLWKWLSPTLAAVAGSIITFLVISYLQHAK
jgi:chromosome segregation ATPase